MLFRRESVRAEELNFKTYFFLKEYIKRYLYIKGRSC